MTTTTNNPLLQAADYIAEAGWCRGDWYRADGKACLAGAVGVVTGALVPLSREKREKALRRYAKRYGAGIHNTEKTIADALAGKGHLKDVYVYDWSKSQRTIRQYGKAMDVLSRHINAERHAELVEEHDAHVAGRRQAPFYLNATDKEKRASDAAWARSRAKLGEDVVVDLNDTDEGSKKKTTKAKAIKLLRTAAEQY